MNKDISKKRDRTTTQRIVIRNEVEYRNPYDQSGDNPYYQSSPTLVSGVYGKRRFRAVMAYGVTPHAFIELNKTSVPDAGDVIVNTLQRGIASVTNTVKGVGTAHNQPNTMWVGWTYNTDRDYSPISPLQAKGKKWTTAEILKDIKSVIDAL